MLCSAAGKEAKLALLTSTALDDQRSHRMVDVIRLLAQCFSVSRLRYRRAKSQWPKRLVCLTLKDYRVLPPHKFYHSGIYYSAAAAEYR